jgi:hypothetical protein
LRRSISLTISVRISSIRQLSIAPAAVESARFRAITNLALRDLNRNAQSTGKFSPAAKTALTPAFTTRFFERTRKDSGWTFNIESATSPGFFRQISVTIPPAQRQTGRLA